MFEITLPINRGPLDNSNITLKPGYGVIYPRDFSQKFNKYTWLKF